MKLPVNTANNVIIENLSGDPADGGEFRIIIFEKPESIRSF
jgi:hypothetical protein